MIARLICRVFGHRWEDVIAAVYAEGARVDPKPVSIMCTRCGTGRAEDKRG